MNSIRRVPKVLLSTIQRSCNNVVSRCSSSSTPGTSTSGSGAGTADDVLEAFRKKSTCVLSNDGSMVICWHPELAVPYEMTQPLPEEIMPTDSVLKVQATLPVREMYRHKHERMIIQELMALTHTPKYAWHREKKRRQYQGVNPLKEKRDREYL